MRSRLWVVVIGMVFLCAIFFGLMMDKAHSKESAPPRPDAEPITVDCSAQIPFGKPTITAATREFCKIGYIDFYDVALKGPRLVAYNLTGDDTFGCLGRFPKFHPEMGLLPAERAFETDYAKTNFDLGHMAPDQDMATAVPREWDSFNMINVWPQLPKFNREGWESLEQNVRDWAWMRGSLEIYVGPVFTGSNHQTIGTDQIAVPERFFKIMVDPKTHDTIAFVMDHVPTRKGDMSGFETTVADIEKQTGISFPLPSSVDKTVKPAMWSIDDSGWHKAHKDKCHAQ